MTHSAFYHTPPKRLSTQSTTSTNLPAFVILELNCYERSTTGLMKKMDVAYFGLTA